ncbi:hypothetical protein EV424DRAFT_861670 [Suillus variegatus]|nr:hypothetical protein EV424DRAFT_861670 [Suillus variegatus]
MAASSSSAVRSMHDFVPPASLVIADYHIADDGVSVVSSFLLRRLFEYHGVSRARLTAAQQYPAGVLLAVFAPTVRRLIDNFPMMTRAHFVDLARSHSVSIKPTDTRDYHLLHARRRFAPEPLPEPFAQSSSQTCAVAKLSSRAKLSDTARLATRELNSAAHRRDFQPDVVTEHDLQFPTICTMADKIRIIAEWQDKMSPANQTRGACAVCAYNVRAAELVSVAVTRIPLILLQNECLPEHTLPRTYDFELYGRAILYPKGMTDCWSLAPLLLCSSCCAYLLRSQPRQPVNSLANFQYYGHERLPEAVRCALQNASLYDLMLISRARASHITHFYSHKFRSGGYRQSEESSQRYNQGNVAIRPQDSPQLQTLLPPSYDEIRDAVCVVFAGHNQTPTRETLKNLQAILVTKSVVKTLIDFLISNNPWYQQSQYPSCP